MENNEQLSVERMQELERQNQLLTEKTQEMENNEQLSVERMQELGRQNQLLQRMGENLQCSICSDVVRQPQSLHCGHSFCSYCIERWAMEKRRAPNGTFCPKCRSPDCYTTGVLMLRNVSKDIHAYNKNRDEVEEEHYSELSADTQTAITLPSSDEEDDVFHDALEELP